MKKLLLKLFLLLGLLLLLDVASGVVFEKLQQRAIGGDTRRNNYINNEMKEDLVFLGSSRCLNHYDPRVFEDELGLSAYNGGMLGNGIILMYPRFRMVTERYAPKAIVYEVTELYDLFESDNSGYLRWSKPFYHRNGVDSVFWAVDPLEQVKMRSSLYQYNSFFLQFLGDNISPKQSDIKGFRPLEGVMDYEPLKIKSEEIVRYDSLKISYMRRMAEECQRKNIRLVYVLSPTYKAEASNVYEPAFDLAREYGVVVLNHKTDERFIHNRNFYADNGHMNGDGAAAYSAVIARELKDILDVKKDDP